MTDYVLPVSAALALLVLTLGISLRMIASHFQPAHPAGLFHGFRSRLLAMELAATPDEVRRILDEHNRRNSALMLQAQYVDSLFVACCWLLVLTIVWQSFQFAPVRVGTAIFCATAAAFFDEWANWKTMQTLRTPLDDSAQGFIRGCRVASVLKWGFVFLTVIAVGSLFGLSAIGLLFWITGMIGLAALASGRPHASSIRSRFPYGWRLEFATRLVSLCLILLAVVFLFIFLMGMDFHPKAWLIRM